MLKRLFLSIVILSTLAYEGGTSYSTGLIDYYLLNFNQLDIIQDSRNAISSYDVRNLSSIEKKGTPVAFFKLISQNSLNSKVSNDNHLQPIWLSCAVIVLAIFILLFIYLNKRKLLVTKRSLLSLADSSPPVYC